MTEPAKDIKTEQKVEIQEYIKKMSGEVDRLVKEGKSLEEALALTQHHIPAQRVMGNRIEYIKSLTSIEALDKSIHHSHAKLSKARKSNSTEAMARYQEEIKTAQDRKLELQKQIDGAEDSLKKAQALGTSASGLVQMIIGAEENRANETLKKAKAALKWSNKALKAKVGAEDTKTPEWLDQKLLDVSIDCQKQYADRLAGGDKRVETLNRKLNLIAKLKEQAKDDTKTETKPEVTPKPEANVGEDIQKKQKDIKAKFEAAKKDTNKKLQK